MARIRTIKPEMFSSESLAEVSLSAERTFTGLLTQADDFGRHRDHAAVIAGSLWALRREHTPVHVEEDLQKLANAGLICRYTGCDGRAYLHVVTWAKHQKINRKTPSRISPCLVHDRDASCAPCQAPVCVDAQTVETPADGHSTAVPAQSPLTDGSVSAHGGLTADAMSTRNALTAPPLPRSWTVDPGTGTVECAPERKAIPPTPQAVHDQAVVTEPPMPQPPTTAQQLVDEYVAECACPPPRRVLGQLGGICGQLLAEGFDAPTVRNAMIRLRERALHPSVLPSLVNEIVNPAAPRQAPRERHRAYADPVDPAAAYGEAL